MKRKAQKIVWVCPEGVRDLRHSVQRDALVKVSLAKYLMMCGSCIHLGCKGPVKYERCEK